MNTINDSHNKAMDLVELALIERAKGTQEEVSALFEEALVHELAAISKLDQPVEPTFSVLHRSAGWIAFNCQQYRMAEKLVATALAHDPPSEIAEELRDLLEQVQFQRHLRLKGVSLGEDEFQMSLSGQAVGLGVVRSDEFSVRIGESSRLLQRIIERRMGRPFREGGSPTKDVRDYELFVTVPRAASFAVTFRLGQPSQQLSLPGMSDTAEIVDEFMDLMDLVNSGRVDEVQERVSEPAYLRNFLGLVKKIAPDGERIRQVGFTSVRNGVERFVSMTSPSSTLPVPPVENSIAENAELVEIQGTLLYADARNSKSSQIRIIDDEKKTHTVDVPEGMMNDIVRPMWELTVGIKGVRGQRNIIMLQDIWSLDSD